MVKNKTINELISYFESKENRTEQEEKFLEELKENRDIYPITGVSKEDIESRGFDPSKLTDEDMVELADRMEDDYLDQLFWESLDCIAEDIFELTKEEIEDKEE